MYENDLGTTSKKLKISLQNTKNKLKNFASTLIERVAELDEELTMKYLEGEEITIEEIKALLRKGRLRS